MKALQRWSYVDKDVLNKDFSCNSKGSVTTEDYCIQPENIIVIE